MKKADLVKIFKISLKVIFSFLFASILVLYIALNIYVKSKELKVSSEEIKKECDVELSDWQIKCASEIITKNKNPKFARLPLITDAFSKRNAFAYHTAYSIYCEKIEEEKLKKIPTMEWRFMMLATKRYITRHINYKDCYNYMFSKTYFGLGMFGLKDISEPCFNKSYDKLDKEEFEKYMEEAKKLAKESRKQVADMNIQNEDLLKFLTPSEFLYDTYELSGVKVVGLFKDGKETDTLSA